MGETGTVQNHMKHHHNMDSNDTNRLIYQHPKTHNSNFSVYKLTIIDQAATPSGKISIGLSNQGQIIL